MIKDFFIKKENIFIGAIALASIFFVVLGFLFLFLKPGYDEGPRIIPNSISEITWEDFKSKIINQKIVHPQYMYVSEQEEDSGTGVNITEFATSGFMSYFSNQNHFSIYPKGIESPFFYARTQESTFQSKTGQDFIRTEYLTVDGDVWAVKLDPVQSFDTWGAFGFILIETRIRNRTEYCQIENGALVEGDVCDPYLGHKTVFSGDVSKSFIELGYEIVNKNTFK